MFAGEDGEDFAISGFISGAWNIHHRFTQENGKAVYGPADPRFREYMVLMNRWYKNGLLDAEFAANDWDIHDEKFLDNRVFAIAGAMGGHFTRYTTLLRAKNPGFMMNAVKYPVQRKGDKPQLGYYAGSFPGIGAAITTSCKNVEAAARLLNYDYSDEGFILANFGFEGETFIWEPGSYTTQLVTGTHAGYPRYTDQILNNPKYTKDYVTAILLRVRDHIGIKAPEFLEQRDSLPEQVGPLGRGQWMDIDNKYWMPAVTATQQESAELSRIMNDINTYADEMFVKFVTGAEALTDANYNNYVQTIRRMNLDRAIQIVTAQIDRYNKRP
jgi:putative aldouronate transport system substrate-binding protein